MTILLSNLPWMGFNLFLALVAVVFGWLMAKARYKLLFVLYGVVWLVFLPNTLYLLTDLVHLFRDLHKVGGVDAMLVVLQYVVLLLAGIITYFAAVYPAEKVFVGRMKWNRTLFIGILNVLVGFGMTLGRVERVNSWAILTNASRVIHSSTRVLFSMHLVFLSLCFALLGTLLYFLLRACAPYWRKRYTSKTTVLWLGPNK